MIDYAEILDLSTDAIFVRTESGEIVYWSHGAELTYGYTEAEAIGRISFQLLQTRFPAPLEVIEAEVRARGRWSGEIEQTAKDGRRLTIDSYWALSLASTAGGKPVILQINTDITERSRTERLLRASETRFRGLLESAPDAIVIVDRKGEIVLANRQVSALFGYDAGELIGQPVEVLVPERLAHAHVAHREGYMRVPRTRPMGAGMELTGRNKAGREFPVEISLSPLGEGEDLLVTAAVRDVSERKQQEAALRHMHKLEMAQREHLATLGEIAAGMAHEIRNPLAGISAALHILASNLAIPENRGVVEEMQQQVSRIGRTVDELLHYARPQPLHLTSGDLNQTVDAVAQFLRRQARERDIEIRFAPEEMPPVAHDPQQIHRLVTNLVLNAIHAVADGGCVEIVTHCDAAAGEARIEVRDNGTGIAPGDLEKIFRPFFSTKGGRGTGLGLSLCRRIVDLHGGSLTVRSEPGKGSVFTAVIPMQPAAAGADRSGDAG